MPKLASLWKTNLVRFGHIRPSRSKQTIGPSHFFSVSIDGDWNSNRPRLLANLSLQPLSGPVLDKVRKASIDAAPAPAYAAAAYGN